MLSVWFKLKTSMHINFNPAFNIRLPSPKLYPAFLVGLNRERFLLGSVNPFAICQHTTLNREELGNVIHLGYFTRFGGSAASIDIDQQSTASCTSSFQKWRLIDPHGGVAQLVTCIQRYTDTGLLIVILACLRTMRKRVEARLERHSARRDARLVVLWAPSPAAELRFGTLRCAG